MANLDAAQLRNLPEAYATSDAFAAKYGIDLWLVRDVMTTMLVTESAGGHIYANNGQGFKEPSEGHTPWNWNSVTGQPIGTPSSRAQMRGILLQSMDQAWLAANGIHYDLVGSNGRSTGPAQQLSGDTGGAWGPMAGTMRMSSSMQMFLDKVDWNDQSTIYKGKQMPNKESAMLLRVQQPLPSEVGSTDYTAALAKAKDIARDPRFAPGSTTTGELDAATTSEINDAVLKGF
jgi:hypothetical protein